MSNFDKACAAATEGVDEAFFARLADD